MIPKTTYFTIDDIKCEYTEHFTHDGVLNDIRIWSCRKENLTENFPSKFVNEISNRFNAEWRESIYEGKSIVLPIRNSDDVLHFKTIIRNRVISRISAYIEFK